MPFVFLHKTDFIINNVFSFEEDIYNKKNDLPLPSHDIQVVFDLNWEMLQALHFYA